MGAHHNDKRLLAVMPTLFITRRDRLRTRAAQAQLEASREWQVTGTADSLFRARAALPHVDPDALLIDLRLEDGAALSLVRELRDPSTGARRAGAERPKVMLLAADAADPLLFSTLVAGADAYLLEADLSVAASQLKRMLAGEATMATPLARQTLQFFGEPIESSKLAPPDDRALDWHNNGANPMKLSPGERRALQLLAAGAKSGELAARMGLSLEAVGRRIGNVCRKLSWDVRSGSLALLAA
jgi:DNA-binding NarL/FixJ family response regulator